MPSPANPANPAPVGYPPELTKYLSTLPYRPSEEQLQILHSVLSSDANIMISALAGAAKTSTLKMIAYALPKKNIISLAFNVSIAREMAEELPSNCTCKTFNALGNQIWGDFLGSRPSVNKGKMYNLLSAYIDEELAHEPEAKSIVYENFAAILKFADIAKAHGHLPDRFFDSQPEKLKVTRLLSDDELLSGLDEELPPQAQVALLEILNVSSNEALLGRIDYADQILFAALYARVYPLFSIILTDEAQDLSELNHIMLQKLYRRRIIAVGDRRQAIYAFRGAHEEGMDELRKRFSMEEKHLTTTFRCPEAIVQHVRPHAPAMKSFGDKPGEVKSFSAWDAADLPQECTILCRNNAPLFSLAVNLLSEDVYPDIQGDETINALGKQLKKFGPAHMTSEVALRKLSSWKTDKLARTRRKRKIFDQYDCMHLFISSNPTLGEAISHFNRLLMCKGDVKLMTCHKSKGLEFDEVFILDETLLTPDGQDPNLHYVAATRTRRNLTYITSEGYMGGE